jgi:hypothetical protein
VDGSSTRHASAMDLGAAKLTLVSAAVSPIGPSRHFAAMR